MRRRLVLLLGILLTAILSAFAILALSGGTKDPYLFPNVYIHPGATAHEVTPTDSASFDRSAHPDRIVVIDQGVSRDQGGSGGV